MPHSVSIRHLVRITVPALGGQKGTREVVVDNVESPFEPGFHCGWINGQKHKYHDHSIVKKWRVTKEIDRDGKTVDERTEEILS